MNRLVFPFLLAGTVLLAAPLQAQTKKPKTADGWGSADGWAAPAPKKAAAPVKKATAAPIATEEPVVAAPTQDMAAPANEMNSGAGGFGGAAAAVAPSAESQMGGASVAPGFSAAPSHRVTTDYRGRPIAPYVRRNVRRPDPVVVPAPVAEPEPAPLVEATEVAAPATAASAKATKASGGAMAAPKAVAPKKTTTAPKKAAPAKKKDDGWGSGGSGW